VQKETEVREASGQSNPRSRFLTFVRKPRVSLYLLAAWSLLSAVTELFVNSGLFLDIHDSELDGAIGGFAFSFDGVPLALLYLYCSRDPNRYHQVFWLAFAQQAAMAAGSLYHLVLGTFSPESVVIPVAGSLALAALSLAQVFEPQSRRDPPTSSPTVPPPDAPSL
jgi:hypothetical protein